MAHSDNDIRDVLNRAKVIAVVGFSANPQRPSHGVAQFLQGKGHRIIPVNPGLAGQVILGETVYANLDIIPDAVDMIDIFRQSHAVPEIVVAALARWPDLFAIWMQLGVMHDQAALVARGRGVRVVQNRCPVIEYARLAAS